MPRKTKKKQMRPIGYERPRRELDFEYAKRKPVQTITQQLLNVAMKPVGKKIKGRDVERINLKSAVTVRKGSTYEYIKSVRAILRQILRDAKRADDLDGDVYDLLVLMAVEIANTVSSLKRDLGVESNDEEGLNRLNRLNRLNMNANNNANSNNNAEDIFEKVEEVYELLNEQMRTYSQALRTANMNTIETSEALLENIAVTLDGAIQEAKNQMVAEEPEHSDDLDDLMSLMSAMKPFEA